MEQKKQTHIAALTAGKRTPSTRFRLRQYIPYLEPEGFRIEEHIPFFGKSCGLPSPFKMAARIPGVIRSHQADMVWLGKELVQGYETFECLLKKPRVLDVDDAIWLRAPFGRWAAKSIAAKMDTVVAGNEYLADYFSKYCPRVHIVPTGLNLARFQMRDDTEINENEFVIGWTGLAVNFTHLNAIETILGRFMQEHQNVRLMIVAQRPWQHNLPKERVEFVAWTPDNETAVLKRMSVGIMPLTDTPWTRGKCSFKMLQYMAVGLPVVVSPVGMNDMVLNQGQNPIGFPATSDKQWYDALETIYNNREQGRQMGREGRRVIEQNLRRPDNSPAAGKDFS